MGPPYIPSFRPRLAGIRKWQYDRGGTPKKTTQDIVVIKMQHTIFSSESRDVTQDVVMQFRNVVNMQH